MDPNENKNYYPEDSSQGYNGGMGQNPADGQYQGQQYGGYQIPDYQNQQSSSGQYQTPDYSSNQYQSPDYQAPQYQAPQYQTPQYQAPYQQPSYQATPYGEEPRKGSGLSIASMVCGILSVVFCCGMWISWILSVIAIILGAVAIGKKAGGKGMAIAGIVTGALGLVLSVALLIFIVAAGESASSFDYYSYYNDLF